MLEEIMMDLFLFELWQLEILSGPGPVARELAEQFYDKTLRSVQKTLTTFSPQHKDYETMQELVQLFV